MKKYVDRDIESFKIDLEKLEDWKDNTEEALPICSFISFYRALGLEDKVKQIIKEEERDIVPFDNIVCNFFTLQAIKNFIKRQWQIYSIDIDGDNHVYWKDDQFGREKHYEKTLKPKIEASLTADFAHYCPGTDDELEDFEIIFRVFDQVEVDEDEEMD